MSADRPRLGLRERKKAKTRATIQMHALQLFREQGYDATTVEQISEAAEISPSTFFRYFPTKEAVVLTDDYDPLFIEAFRAQPPERTPIQALRTAMRETFALAAPADLELLRERSLLILEEPDLRAAVLNQFAESMKMYAELVAERVGRDAGDFAARAFAGALHGVMLAALFAWAEDPSSDMLRLMDEAVEFLENGLQL